MTKRYQDGMAIVLNNGKPNIFITVTCNPSWIEITSELGLHQTPQDRPDLLTRIFQSKFEQLKDDVINKGVLGRVKIYMYVTEFQKHGLPHVHMLLILDTDDKLREPEEYYSMVKAKIPRHESEPELYEDMLKHMIHGPCGVLNQSSPCMKNGHCKRRYPKDFCEETRQGNDSYPEYMRRFSDPIFLNRNKFVDNRWVVPYNPWLLLKYDRHINVDICSNIKSIKYLYKYVYKGPDRVAMEIHRGMLLRELRDLLLLPGKLIKNYDLPILIRETNEVGGVPTIIQEELSIRIPDEDIQSVEKLNNDQVSAYNTIMNRSQLWATTKILHLRQNMLSIHDHEFAQFLMRIGDGNEPAKEDDMVKMPAEIVIPWEGESSIKKPIQHKFPQLENHGWDASYMVERAILTPKNCDVHMLNDMITNKFPRDEHILLSFDEVESDTHNLYQQEYLRTIAPGHNAGKRAFLPRIKLKTTDGVGLPFVLIRKQFHVKLSFEITINKSQGQTIPNVRIYLPRHVFSHGQLTKLQFLSLSVLLVLITIVVNFSDRVCIRQFTPPRNRRSLSVSPKTMGLGFAIGFVGVLILFHAAYSTIQYRALLKITEEEFSGSPLSVVFELSLGLLLCTWAALTVPGKFLCIHPDSEENR
ncbi:hypothetical protein KIW84_061988 [Lathyrus oleraceus]|uniref:Helitron helicase-like domain-containing protein n=1 Tax=Pisum sativum TaxID=3888 RepID=A0A9D4W6I5_PEA|nr:hypothetical protein KIW84_061988 [Pisum sativum]